MLHMPSNYGKKTTGGGRHPAPLGIQNISEHEGKSVSLPGLLCLNRKGPFGVCCVQYSQVTAAVVAVVALAPAAVQMWPALPAPLGGLCLGHRYSFQLDGGGPVSALNICWLSVWVSMTLNRRDP